MAEKPAQDQQPEHEEPAPFHQELTVDPPLIASDYPSQTGAEMAEETAATLHTKTPEVDHRPGEHPDMPFEVASDYPAETGEELVAHRHEG